MKAEVGDTPKAAPLSHFYFGNMHNGSRLTGRASGSALNGAGESQGLVSGDSAAMPYFKEFNREKVVVYILHIVNRIRCPRMGFTTTP